MLAVAWPFGFPARFADSFGLAQDRSGGAQTRGTWPESSRRAQTMCALSPVLAALLGHTTRPEETTKTMSLFLMADQLAEPYIILWSHLWSRSVLYSCSCIPGACWGKDPRSLLPPKGARTDRPPHARNGEQRSIGSRPPEDRYKANESFRRGGTLRERSD